MAHDLILIIDNDLVLAHSIALLLQHVGYIVTTAGSIRDAEEQINTGQFRLVILNCKMPGTTSTLIPLISNTYPYLSLVILEDQTLLNSEQDSMPLSAHYLSKPVDPQVLLDSINRILH